MTSAGHRIVEQLAACGVERAYLVPGESFLDVLDGLVDSPVRAVVCRQEGGAGFMALAEGRLTGIPGVAMVTRGPGAANAMIAVHTAHQDATPLVLFVGLVPVADRDRFAFQEFSLEGWFGTTAKRVFTLDDPRRAAETVREAFRIAGSGRPGPVVVGLPEDVLREDSTAPATAPAVELAESLTLPASFAHRLAAAERPLLVAGGDGWSGDTGARLAAWAEAADVAIVGQWRGDDAVPNDAPAYGGWLGYGRDPRVAARLADADLHVYVGCVRDDVDSEGYTAGLDVPTVLVLDDAEALGHAGRLDAHVRATPAAFVAALPAADTVRGTRGPAWRHALRADASDWATPRPDGGTGVDLGIAFAHLRDGLPADAVLTYGAGNATLWGHRYLPRTHPNSLVAPRNGAMGLGVPAAVAAALVFPDRLAVAVCGDGDFLMNGQELATAVAAGVAPLVIVVDNGHYGTIVQHQRAHYPGRPSGTSMTNPDFGAWMRSFGGHGERLESADDVPAALERALAAPRPRLLHLVTDPNVSGPEGLHAPDRGDADPDEQD